MRRLLAVAGFLCLLLAVAIGDSVMPGAEPWPFPAPSPAASRP